MCTGCFMDHEEVVRQVSETAAQVDAIDEKLTTFIADIKRDLIGNGKPGIFTRLENIEKREARMIGFASGAKWVAGGAIALISFIIGLWVSLAVTP